MTERENRKEENIHSGIHGKNSSVPKQETGSNSSANLDAPTEEPEPKTTIKEVFYTNKIHSGKKLKDFIFEFLMLFLAITGSFFMENMRESRIERHKEKEYISSLIKDIENDTSNIQRIIRHNQKLNKGIDSLVSILDNPVPKNIKLSEVYNFTFNYLNQYEGFAPKDITIIQLKNSSRLGLIENKSVSDSIAIYYAKIEHYRELNGKLNTQLMNDNLKMEMSFLDFNAMTTNKWKLYDTSRIKEFQNRAIVFNSCIIWDNQWLQGVFVQGSSLLKYLRKEYDLKS